jgi:hypothetical protein
VSSASLRHASARYRYSINVGIAALPSDEGAPLRQTRRQSSRSGTQREGPGGPNGRGSRAHALKSDGVRHASGQPQVSKCQRRLGGPIMRSRLARARDAAEIAVWSKYKRRPCTYRSPYREIENPLRNQCSRWISVARGAPRYLAKVRRFASRKVIQNQLLTSSVLNPRSRELWRKTVRETEFRVTAGAAQCGGLRANVRVYWVFLRGRKWAENVARG